MTKEIHDAFGRADIAEVLRAIERHFPGSTYSLRTLFRDEQKKILDEVLGATLEGVERNYEQIYSQFAPLMRYLASLGQPVPKALHQAAEYTLTARLRRELERGRAVDLEAGRALVREARDAGVTLEGPELGRATEAALEEMLAELSRDPDDLPLLELTRAVASFAGFAGLRFDPVVSQNRFYEMRESVYGARRVAPMSQRPGHDKWIRAFRDLGAQLGVRVD